MDNDTRPSPLPPIPADAAAPGDGIVPARSWWVRHYGTYRAVVLDLVLAIAVGLVFTVALVAGSLVVARLATGTVTGGVLFLQSPVLVPLSLLLTEIGLLVLLWYRMTRNRLPWSLLGIAPSQLRAGLGRGLAIGVVVGAGTLVLSEVLGLLLERLGLNQSGQAHELADPLRHAPAWVIIATILLGTLLAPIVEESFFRGYVFQALRTTKGAAWAYVVSAAAFAVVHLLPPQMPVFFVAGLILALTYARSGTMVANITAHAVNNGVSLAVLLLPLLPHG